METVFLGLSIPEMTTDLLKDQGSLKIEIKPSPKTKKQATPPPNKLTIVIVPQCIFQTTPEQWLLKRMSDTDASLSTL